MRARSHTHTHSTIDGTRAVYSIHDHDFIHNDLASICILCISSANHIWPSYKSQKWYLYCYYPAIERCKRDSHFFANGVSYFTQQWRKMHLTFNRMFTIRCGSICAEQRRLLCTLILYFNLLLASPNARFFVPKHFFRSVRDIYKFREYFSLAKCKEKVMP